MAELSSAPFVVALSLVATLAAYLLVRRLSRRRGAGLRARMVALIVGLAGAELAMLPALVVALAGDALLGLRGSSVDHWIVIAVYAALTVYVIARLFPWREVEALAADPDAGLRDLMARVMARDRDGDAR